MTPFRYERAADEQQAVALAAQTGASYIGGGTNLVDLMRETIARPTALVDVTGLSTTIAENGDTLRVGAAVRNTVLASDMRIRRHFPMLAEAVLAGASAQIRNMATVGGNILQRTRCTYFYDDAARCNKRAPGSGCDAIDGFNRNHAILGTSAACVATHPSDMCVALAALDATVSLQGPRGQRTIALADLHRLPGDTPERDTEIDPGELITAVTLPPNGFAGRSTYRKIRDRASYAFALVSLAAGLEVEDGQVKTVRLALGGVAHKPWRARKAEAALVHGPATVSAFRRAVEIELADAEPLKHNGFKVELARRVMIDTLGRLVSDEEITR